MAYRAFFALPPENFTTTTGQPTNAVYGFTSMIINLLKEYAPSHLAVAFDVSRKSFRTDIFPEYKAGRAKTPEEFKGQVELIKEVLSAMQVTLILKEGYEADDLIATLATQATTQDFAIEIVTGDRDSFALINDSTTVLYPRKGVSDLVRMTPQTLDEKYHLTPDQYPDFAALRGDPSDNLPGVPGVGEKTAEKWINTYGSLSSIVEHADEITGKVGESLRANLPQVLMNRQITELVRDVELEVSVEQLERRDFALGPVNQLFDTLQFNTLRSRIASVPGAEAASSESSLLNSDQVGVDVAQMATEVVHSVEELIHLDGPVSVAISGVFAQGSGNIESIAVSNSSRCVVMLDVDNRSGELLLNWLADDQIEKIVHDGKEFEWCTQVIGRVVGGLTMDTALAAYLVDPGQRSYSLTDVAQRFLGITVEREPEQLSLLGEPDGAIIGATAQVTLALSHVLTRKLDAMNLLTMLHTIEIPTQTALAKMEHAGIAVDIPRLKTLSHDFAQRIRAAEEKGYALVGREFNFGSPKQLQEVLFVERGLPKTKKIKTGYTTDAEALAQLFAKTSDPLLEQILTWREESKLRQTVESLIPLADSNSRIHTTFKQTVAATGRLSSADPNLQNIPIRTEQGREIRAAFVVGEGFECLLTADYSQIELRIMAHLSEDKALIQAFKSGEDLHDSVARQVFDVKEVTPEMRRQVKAMSYGLAYGLSPYGLANQLDISPADAKIMMDDYFSRFGGIRDYLGKVVDEARQNNYTETIFGRRRHLPDLNSDNRQRREIAERMALNAPIQGSAADIVKIAMLNVESALSRAGFTSRLLLQVHDELVLEIAPGELAPVSELVRTEMESAVKLTVPMDVNIGSGPNWDAAAH